MPRLSTKPSKRRTPRNASRRISTDQASPSNSTVLATEHSRWEKDLRAMHPARLAVRLPLCPRLPAAAFPAPDTLEAVAAFFVEARPDVLSGEGRADPKGSGGNRVAARSVGGV